MEAALLHSSPDQSISPNKQFTNRKRNNQPLISRSSENFTPSNFHGGLLHAPRRSLSFLNPQPPLLPLPIPKPNINPFSRGLSCPSKKIKNRKKSKTPVNSDSKPDLKSTECVLIGSTNPLGPDPKDLPKDVSRVLSSSAEKFSDLSEVFSLSPPPSSLPLPTFSLRPKLSCNPEAAGIDGGATDNLRRILRLR
ncbi:unnamed protein product [Camellia sinensis]